MLLKQRVDELTKLMASVKGYMKHEKKLLTALTKARTAMMQAEGVSGKAEADNLMSATLKTLFAVAENYPDLKANQNFLQFQNRVTGIESSIADRREFYNDSVNLYNIRCEQFPYVIIARMFGYMRKELFKVAAADREDVKVSF